MARQHELGLERCEPSQRIEVILQRVGRALRVESDVWTDVRQQLIAREKETALRLEQADMPWRVTGRPFDAQPVLPHRQHLGAIKLHRDATGGYELAQGSGCGAD